MTRPYCCSFAESEGVPDEAHARVCRERPTAPYCCDAALVDGLAVEHASTCPHRVDDGGLFGLDEIAPRKSGGPQL